MVWNLDVTSVSITLFDGSGVLKETMEMNFPLVGMIWIMNLVAAIPYQG